MTENGFYELVARREGEHLDFKAQQYDFLLG
jgi:hypothetical protein